MHPLELGRMIARSQSADLDATVEETLLVLRFLSGAESEASQTVRQILTAHPWFGPLWWLAAHIITALDIDDEVAEIEARRERDRTDYELIEFLNNTSRAVVVGPVVRLLRAVRESRVPEVHLVGMGVYEAQVANHLVAADKRVSLLEDLSASAAGSLAADVSSAVLAETWLALPEKLRIAGPTVPAYSALEGLLEQAGEQMGIVAVTGLGVRLPATFGPAVTSLLEGRPAPNNLQGRWIDAAKVRLVIGDSGPLRAPPIPAEAMVPTPSELVALRSP